MIDSQVDFYFLADIGLSWVSSRPPGTISIKYLLSSTCNMASKRVGSKDIVESSTGDVVEQLSMSLPIYANKHMFIEKDIKITWQDINNIFAGSFEDNLEDQQVYFNIHK